MRRHTIVRTGLFSFAAGAVLVLGGVAEPASASASAVVPGLATDCDVSGGQPGGEHAPGGHDSHGTAGETSPPADGEMDHSMPMEDGEMDHSMPMEDGGTEHGSHGAGATVEGPSDGTRTSVLTGFSVLNGAALAGAAFLRRRTSSKRGRHLAARAAARPASARPNRSDLDGEQR